MRYRRGSAFVWLIGCLGAAGCVSADEAEGPTEPRELRSETQSVSFDEVEGATTPLSGITDSERLVIRSMGSWSAFWSRLHANITPEPDLPSIDFERQLVIAAAMGLRSTGGYGIRVEEVSRTGEDIEVVVVESSPGPGCLTTQAFTAPATAIAVALPVGNVEFVEEAKTHECS